MEINCFVCGDPFITNEAIEVDYNTFVYICQECQERAMKGTEVEDGTTDTEKY